MRSLSHFKNTMTDKCLRLYLSVMTCPLAQKQARHTLLHTDTTSALSTKDDSVMLWTKRQDWEGIKNTLACLSEHTTARCPSPLVSCEDDGEKLTSLRFRGLSGSSGALGSRQISYGLWMSPPMQSRKLKRNTDPFSIRAAPEWREKAWSTDPVKMAGFYDAKKIKSR